MTEYKSQSDTHIHAAIDGARTVWVEWQAVFEHHGPISTNPILTDAKLFNHFSTSWAVGRTIRAGTRDEMRCTLRDSEGFANAIADHSGQTLDEFEKNTLRPRFGTGAGARSLRSAVSKVARFVAPEWFTAWDRFAPVGLNCILGRSASARFENYAHYLADFNCAWAGPHGVRIRQSILSVARSPFEKTVPFQKFALDLYLMKEGGYEERIDLSGPLNPAASV